ncbi:MAG: efflux RND transporter periplasmic adaptor subunit [Campylobacterales bacterium]|nr:efflux RND transporter periplasmic adaptor subunit [Campylobacterales bacterium]
MKKTVFFSLLLLVIQTLSASEIQLTGTVVSDGQKMIGSRYMGYVKEVFVKLGDRVKREDDLYEMESAEFDIMKSQADLALEQAQIVVEFWQERIRILQRRKEALKNKKNIVPQTDLDNIELMADNAVTMLETSRVAVKQMAIKAKQMATIYNYIKMKAPADGVVVQKNIKPGDMVMPGMLTIMIVDTEDLEIDVSISENIIKYVRRGDKVKVEIPSINYEVDGNIKAIIPDANPMTHKITMRISFDRGKENIFPGMYAKVTISKI